MIEMLERRQRAMDAARVTLMAAALEQVVETAESGRSREIAYRSLRAEFATALGQSEHLVEQQMSLAHSLTNDYRAVHEAMDRGEIAYAHARVIVEAGTVIGPGDAPQTVARRAGYVLEALETAVREAPNRLRATARVLAESWAETHIEERHREARARRQVALVDEDDGMALLLARLPAVEAHAAFDRITRLAQACERGERVVRDLGGAGVAAPSLDADTGIGIGIHAGIHADGRAHADTGTHADGGTDADTRANTGTGAGSRTRDQLRADVLADLLLASDEQALFAGDAAESVRARVQLVIPVETVEPGPARGKDARADDGTAGRTDDRSCNRVDDGTYDATGEQADRRTDDRADPGTDRRTGRRMDYRADDPDHGRTDVPARDRSSARPACELLGYGAIDGGAARRVAGAAAEWNRVLVESVTGEVIRVERYRPSEQMRRTLGARDRRCRFPGCRVPVSRCDLDHTVDAALGGATSTDNLAHLCRGHHVLKHHSEWRVVQQQGGELRWTSPAGRSYVDRPERLHMPRRGGRREEPPEPARSAVLRSVRAVRFALEDDSAPMF